MLMLVSSERERLLYVVVDAVFISFLLSLALLLFLMNNCTFLVLTLYTAFCFFIFFSKMIHIFFIRVWSVLFVLLQKLSNSLFDLNVSSYRFLLVSTDKNYNVGDK